MTAQSSQPTPHSWYCSTMGLIPQPNWFYHPAAVSLDLLPSSSSSSYSTASSLTKKPPSSQPPHPYSADSPTTLTTTSWGPPRPSSATWIAFGSLFRRRRTGAPWIGGLVWWWQWVWLWGGGGIQRLAAWMEWRLSSCGCGRLSCTCGASVLRFGSVGRFWGRFAILGLVYCFGEWIVELFGIAWRRSRMCLLFKLVLFFNFRAL